MKSAPHLSHQVQGHDTERHSQCQSQILPTDWSQTSTSE